MIKQIIKEELVEIYFQPIISIRTKSVYAFESLTRCNFNGQQIPPNMLFNLASESGLNIQLDEMTRNKAIKKFYNYYKEKKDLILFLNIESEMINNFKPKDFKNGFLETILKLKIPFRNFLLEIKEDEIENTNSLKEFCTIYRNLGFQIALDDFGTGSSNFDRINLIRPNIIKIDKSLFKDAKNNHVNKEIVNAISKMSHNLGIRVLAEGVEDDDSICIGMKSSITLYQGYYFHKPSSEISTLNVENIIKKIVDIGNRFKKMNIKKINRKREVINKFELISNELIEKISNINEASNILYDELKKYVDLEAIYLIDAYSSKQIHNTIMDENTDNMFTPSMNGDEHYLKEYFYITLESKRGIFLSQKYVSYATGNVCKTFAKRFMIDNKRYILCLDIVIEGL